MKYILLILGVIAAGVGQLALKKGVETFELKLNLRIFSEILGNKYILLGLIIYGTGSLLWLYLLKKFQISVVYPVAVSLSFIVVLIGSSIFFQESINLNKVLGIGIILLGTFLLLTSR